MQKKLTIIKGFTYRHNRNFTNYSRIQNQIIKKKKKNRKR